MKKKITFDKNVEFPTMIGEITEISLEHDLKFVDDSNVLGDLLLTGKYKLTEASRLEEDFNYNIPIEISLTERIDLNSSSIEITDFTYEIVNDNTIDCHIELEIEGLEILNKEEKEEVVAVRECDGDNVVEEEHEVVIEADDTLENDSLEDDSLFTNLNDEDTYGTFIVYIVRQNESINSIIEKYHTTIEELQKYNDIDNINIGTKLIIPYSE